MSNLASPDIASQLQLAIANSTSFSSIATDAQGVIQIFNTGAERMLGYAAAEVVNRMTPADISEPRELIDRAAALSAEVGTGIAPGFNALVFKASRGIEDIYLLIGTDNTVRNRFVVEQRLLDQRLQESNVALQAAKLAAEKANLAKSDFLSSMSHELRSPMNAILGFAQLMESGTPSPSPGQRESIGQILQAGWYLLDLINEVLDLALIESGRMSLSPEPISLADVLADCRSMIDPLAQQHGISLHLPRLEDAPYVKADRTRLKQVLINLLSNAVKYNRPDGAVEVLFTIAAADCIHIGVHDTGGGLPPEKLAQLFQPFNRLGRETGTVEGTGIGLVVSKRLVEFMGGTIGARSRLGAGSEFWIELQTAHPARLAEAAPHDVPVSAAIALPVAALTLLCVEDNPANLLLVQKILERRPDIRLLVARDGSHGVEMARTARPDVILMDVNLPGISGIAALGILAAGPETAHMPVVALSANAMPADIEKGLAAGFFRYLTKPIKVDVFLETLDVAFAAARCTAAGATRSGVTH